MRSTPSQPHVDAVFRREHARVFAHLVARYGDFDVAGDAMQDAYVAALETWAERGIPNRPGAWITTVALNAVRGSLRHDAVVERKRAALEQLAQSEGASDQEDIPDERLRLLFTCCHPALREPARIALTLRTVCGLSTTAIARLFLQPEATVAQRIVRAKRKIKTARIPYVVPQGEELAGRTDDVIACVYLMFTEGYAPHQGARVVCESICAEAIRLARVLCHAFPRHAEARGLLALMLLHHARHDARADPAGHIVALEEQDRSRWDRARIAEGTAALDEALARHEPGPLQLQGAIAALHATADSDAATDWPQIAGLYAELHRRAPSPSIAIAWVVAESKAGGAREGLRRLSALVHHGAIPTDFARLPAARAHLLHRAGRMPEARVAYDAAIANARNEREAAYLRSRRAALTDG